METSALDQTYRGEIQTQHGQEVGAIWEITTEQEWEEW